MASNISGTGSASLHSNITNDSARGQASPIISRPRTDAEEQEIKKRQFVQKAEMEEALKKDSHAQWARNNSHKWQ